MGGKTSSGGWKLVVFLVVPIVLVSLSPVWVEIYARLWGSADLDWVKSVPGPDGPRLLAAGRAGDGYRLAVIDLGDGRELGRGRAGEQPECEPADAEHLWCRFEGEIRLLALPSLDELADQDDLIEASPELASGLSDWAPGVATLRDTGALVVGTNDGLRRAIDPGSRAVVQVAADTPRRELREHVTAEGRQIPFAGVRYRFEGNDSTDRLRLERADGEDHHYRPLVPAVESGAPGAATFLKGRFLYHGGTGAGEQPELPGVPGFFVGHRDSLDEATARGQVSRVDGEGRVLWTTPLEAGQVLLARLVDTRLVVVVGRPGNAALALDAGDGRVLWRHEF